MFLCVFQFSITIVNPLGKLIIQKRGISWMKVIGQGYRIMSQAATKSQVGKPVYKTDVVANSIQF